MKKKIYITITPEGAAQNQITQIVQDLATNNPESRKLPIDWVKPAKFHISLAYLGAVTDEALQAALQAVGTTAVRFPKFDLKIGGLSYLYSDRKTAGSTIVLDILDPEKILKSLFKDLKNELEIADFSPAKHFSPQIVIGILRRQRYEHEQKSMLDSITEIELPQIESFTVEKIDVIELTNDDILYPRYFFIQSITLGLQS